MQNSQDLMHKDCGRSEIRSETRTDPAGPVSVSVTDGLFHVVCVRTTDELS